MAAAGGALSMTAPAFVGYALEAIGGDVELAMGLAPEGPQGFRERVLASLQKITNEETAVADTQRPMALGGRR
jgi:hypothetical protein